MQQVLEEYSLQKDNVLLLGGLVSKSNKLLEDLHVASTGFVEEALFFLDEVDFVVDLS